jgi:hypothetical protein
MGASTETRADGSKVESYNAGPMSIRKETTAAGGSQTTGVYDLGTTKVSMRETLTARQMQERGIDAKMAAGLPNKIPVEGGVAPVPAAAESKATGGRVARIAGEEWTAGKELSDKQLAAIESGIAAGNNYSFRLMEQYDKQKGNKRPSVTGGGVSAASVPGIGDTISKQSGENDQARMDAAKGGGGNTVVSAPTINNNTQNQTSSVKLSPRNNDSTVNKYMQSRWAF